jgi:hypothetical protein
MSARFPFSDLDGLTVWDQARLLEEGIEDVHALATANLVDLLPGTRVPVRPDRLIDQALLCLSVPKDFGDRQPREGLRMFGIRTATDRIRVWDSTRPEAHLVRARIAAVLAGDEETGTAMAEAILASMAGSPNLEHMKAFRRHDWLAA